MVRLGLPKVQDVDQVNIISLPMDLRRLRLFLAVVDEGGFTRAAQAEFVSQPSVSQAMRELEAELGTPLFHRVGRGVTLTAAGEALVGPARQTLRDVETARRGRSSRRARGRPARPVRAPDACGRSRRAPHGAFRTAHPGVTVTLADAEGPAEVASLVITGDAEVGITVEHAANDALRSVALGQQEMLVVLPPGTAIRSRTRAPGRRAREPSDRDHAARNVDASVARRGVRGCSGHSAHRGRHRAARSRAPARTRRCRRLVAATTCRGERGGARCGGGADAAARQPPGRRGVPRQRAVARSGGLPRNRQKRGSGSVGDRKACVAPRLEPTDEVGGVA